MIRVLRVELRRLASRRLVQVLVAVGILAIAVTGVILAVKSHQPTAAELAQAVADRDLNVQECVDHPRRYNVAPAPGQTQQEACERTTGPVSAWVGDDRFALSGLRDVFLGTSLVVAAFGLIVGASFVGAEWHAGTIGTLLTWEPRRTRVLLAKVVACTVAVFVIGVALQALLGAALWLVAATRGTTEGTGGTWLRSVAGVVTRAALLGSLTAAVGMAVASIGRNTAAALGTGFAYLGVVEGIVRGLRPQWQRWLVGDNAVLFLTGVDNRFPPLGRTMTSGGLLLAGYAAVLVLLVLAAFRARDVT